MTRFDPTVICPLAFGSLSKGEVVNSTEISSDDLSLIKDSLLRQKKEILNKRAEFRKEQAQVEIVSEEAELASTDLSNNISIHLVERDRSSLIMIEKALARIDDGTYGQCECCGESIGARRIQARPFTTFCIGCMEDRETLLQ